MDINIIKKLSEGGKIGGYIKGLNNRKRYIEKHCSYCNNPIPYEKRKNSYCSRSCAIKHNRKLFGVKGGFKKGMVNCKGWHTPILINKVCSHCNKEFVVHSYESKRKFCSRMCSNVGRTNLGGVREGSGRHKSGWYKGFYCGSSWELVWVIYNLEHGVKFDRNEEGFDYEFNNKVCKYYPDYIIGNEYFEIKGYKRDNDEFKWKSFPHKLNILFKNDLKNMFEYVITKYGKNFIELYEGNPYNEKKNKCVICESLCKGVCCSRKCSGLNLIKSKKHFHLNKI